MRQLIVGSAVLLTIASYASSAEPPKDFTNSIGMKFKLIPAGEFVMGGAQTTAKPQHKVRITKPFYMGVTEVTQKQFEEVLEQYEKMIDKNEMVIDKTPSYSRRRGLDTSNFPVERVSWENAVEFCNALSAIEDQTYRLPTEAEWEYACRAGSETRYCFGDDESLLDEYAWFVEQPPESGTHPVGEKKPNAWGLYDMHGNVWEWCSDWYGNDYYGQSPPDDPTGPAPASIRVLRGGSWGNGAELCQSSYRGTDHQEGRSSFLGFRVARDPSDK